jgi:endonuclease/exonuclease/phosphatase family metal-dependent hydrolase
MSSAIIDYIGNMRNVVFSGDLNVDQNTQTIAMLEKKLHNPFKNKLSSTFNMKYKKAEHGTFDKSVVDFILTSPDIKVISTSTTDNEDISDHIGLICEIALQ